MHLIRREKDNNERMLKKQNMLKRQTEEMREFMMSHFNAQALNEFYKQEFSHNKTQ